MSKIKKYKIVIRRIHFVDLEYRYDDFDKCFQYYCFLVQAEFDGLISNIWSISLLQNSKVLYLYNNFNHVSH